MIKNKVRRASVPVTELPLAGPTPPLLGRGERGHERECAPAAGGNQEAERCSRKIQRYKTRALGRLATRLAPVLLFPPSSAGVLPPPLSPTTRGGVALLSSSGGFVGHSDDEKTIQELREMLENSILSRDRAESEKTVGTWEAVAMM